MVTVAGDAAVKTEDRGAAETVDVATTDFAKAMVAIGAAIPVEFVIVTVAIVVVGETMVWELFSDFSLVFFSIVLAKAVPEEQVASLYSEWLEVVTGGDVTVILAAAVVMALVLGDSGADLILNFCGPVRSWGVLTPGIFCCRAPTAFIIN